MQDPVIHKIELALDDGSILVCCGIRDSIYFTEGDTQIRFERISSPQDQNRKVLEGGDTGDTFARMTSTLIASGRAVRRIRA